MKRPVSTFHDAAKRWTTFTLPPEPFLPGSGQPHPEREPRGWLAQGADWPTLEPDWDARPLASITTFLWGLDLFGLQFWWEAHIAWEELWLETRQPVRREFLQGLIQLAAAFLQHRRGRLQGRNRLLSKAQTHWHELQILSAHLKDQHQHSVKTALQALSAQLEGLKDSLLTMRLEGVLSQEALLTVGEAL